MYTIAPVRTLEELSDNKVVIHKWLDKALTKAPETDKTEILDRVYKGFAMMWLIRDDETIKGIMITKVKDIGKRRCLFFHLLGGEDAKEWVHLVSDVEQWGRDLGCDYVEIHARLGWTKILKGYKNETTILTREL